MTKEQQRIAIAEWCFPGYVFAFTKDGSTGFLPGEEGDTGATCVIVSDYPNDMNAMWEVESRLNDDQQERYIENIHRVCGAEWALTSLKTTERYEWLALHATAAQRAEALLRTIGKWTDATERK